MNVNKDILYTMNYCIHNNYKLRTNKSNDNS